MTDEPEATTAESAEPATTAGPAATTTTASPRPRRPRVLALVRRVVAVALSLALFAGGIVAGYDYFQRTQPPPARVGDVSTSGIEASPAVKEFVAAMASDDTQRLHAALDDDPYNILIGAMSTYGIAEVTSVETLATMVDGTRSATEVVLIGRQEDRTPVIINLVVHVADGKIVTFR